MGGECRPLTEAEGAAAVRLRKGWANHPLEGRECWVPDAQIEGEIPEELTGTFFRNGPGLSNIYGTDLKHPIDGDGLVCALSFVRGKVHFRSRFVQTFSHVDEKKAQRMLYPGQMGTKTPPGGKRKYRDMSHTNAFFWGGKVMACHEYTYPHALDPRTLETVGRDTLAGSFKPTAAFAAHYRIDQRMNRLVTCGFRVGAPGGKPVLRLVEYDQQWNVLQAATHRIPALNYVHDLLVSPSWYVVQMSPFVKVTMPMVKKIMTGESSPGEQMVYYADVPCRLVFIERFPKKGAEARIVQLDTEPCHIYHFGYCIESDGGRRMRLNAVCLPKNFTMYDRHKVWLSNVDQAFAKLYSFDCDLEAGTLKREQQDTACCEFPTVHPFRQVAYPDADPPRYTYMMAADGGPALPFRDVVKVDNRGSRQVYHSPKGVLGEPIFAPRLGRASAEHGAEDDGWVIVQEYDPDTHETAFLVLDARDLEKAPVAKVKLGFHVPYAFHGTWWPETFVSAPISKL